MPGANFLLDSNVLIGLLNGHALALELLQQHQATPARCAYSSITRMEVLGWAEITPLQETAISALLAVMEYVPITLAVENSTIHLRRTRKIKLPDAIIAATAMTFGMELLTLDEGLARGNL
jgi:predicted nucleic acid-binding protein